MKARSGRLFEGFPLAQRLAEIKAGAEAELADDKFTSFDPTVGQPVAIEEHIGAFGAAVLTAIKMVAKGGRIGHIAVEPFKRLRLSGLGFCGSFLVHVRRR